MGFIIEALTTPGQVILDCFCGTGSGLVAAEKLGRLWIGCDKSRTYCQIAMRELGATEGGLDRHQPSNPGDAEQVPEWPFRATGARWRLL